MFRRAEKKAILFACGSLQISNNPY